MARWIGPSSEHDHFGKVLAAAHVWRDSCFLEGGSIFDDAPLWTPETMTDLTGRLEVDPLDGQNVDFYSKLERQLEAARSEVKQLAAEAIWFAYLFPWRGEMRPQTKRDRITRVWGWSGANSIDDDVHLADETLRGVGRAGQGFRQRLSMELRFLMRVVGEWRALPPDRRIQLMRAQSAWDFADWLDALDEAEQRQIRHMILSFLFPDHFERIVSRGHKIKIVEQLGHRAPSIPARVRTNGEFDRALYEIRRALEAEYETQELDFYFPPLSDLWDKSSRKAPTRSSAPDRTAETEPQSAVWDGPRNTILVGPPGQGQILLDARMSLLFIVFWRCARVAGRVPDGGRVRSVFLRCVEGFGAASGGLGRVAGEPVGWRGGVRTRRRLWGGRTLSVWLVRGALARRRGGVARSAGGLGGDNRSAL